MKSKYIARCASCEVGVETDRRASSANKQLDLVATHSSVVPTDSSRTSNMLSNTATASSQRPPRMHAPIRQLKVTTFGATCPAQRASPSD
eukprot:9496806-Pyramimonas_sp.AAC.1